MGKNNQSFANKIVKNAVFSWIHYGFSTLVSIGLIPYILKHLGDSMYGVWVLVGTFLGYFGFLDFGLSKAVMRFVSKSIGQDEHDHGDKWIIAALYLYSVLAVIGIGISIIVWMITGYVIHDQHNAAIISFVFFIAGIAFSITLPTTICFSGILEAHLRRDIISAIQFIITLLRALAIVYLIHKNHSIVSMVLATSSLSVIQGLATVYYGIKIHGKLLLRRPTLPRSDWKVFIGYALSSFSSQIADIIRFKSSPLIIASYLGLSAVAPFEIAEKLSKSIVSLTNNVLMNLTPAFSQIEGSGSLESNNYLRNTFQFSMKISCYLATLTVGQLFVLSEPFIIRWIGIKYIDVITLLKILLSGYFFAIIQIPTTCMLFATSRQKYYAFTNLIQAVTTIALSIIMVIHYGLLGVAIGVAFPAFIVKVFIQPLGITSALELSVWKFHRIYMIPNLIAPLIYIIALYYISKYFCTPEYSVIIIIATISTLLFIPYIYSFGFTKNERLIFQRVIYRFLRISERS